MPIANLAGGVPAQPVVGSGGRITQAEKEKLQECILGYLKDNPWSAKSGIAGAVGFDASKVAVQMRSLKSNGLIKSSGKKASTVYAIKGEKVKP